MRNVCTVGFTVPPAVRSDGGKTLRAVMISKSAVLNPKCLLS